MKSGIDYSRFNKTALSIAVLALWMAPSLYATETRKAVNVHNFVRAESDMAIKKVYDQVGLGKLLHIKTPTPLDKQVVIRMNRDTLYSTVVVDLSKPVLITLPETSGRYMSMEVISQDHYAYAESIPGRYEITQKSVGTRYAYLVFRTFVDADDPKDIAQANGLQDAIKIEGGKGERLDLPSWNTQQMLEARGALNTLAKLGISTSRALGMKDEVDPIDHLVITASGWGGLPEKYAYYILGSVDNADGRPYKVTVKDVPVRAFWSVTVYDSDGFIAENKLGAYSFNSVTAKKDKDGSTTIHFGGCDDRRVNCLPISKGWNYAIRLYEPEKVILDGSWKFPEIKAER